MNPIVEMNDVRVRFKGERTVHAVNGVSFTLRPGEVLGMLGESSSGKSVTLRACCACCRRAARALTGTIRIDGKDVLALGEAACVAARRRGVDDLPGPGHHPGAQPSGGR